MFLFLIHSSFGKQVADYTCTFWGQHRKKKYHYIIRYLVLGLLNAGST